MNVAKIKQLVQEQLANIGSFDNFHGLTKENLSSFLVDPYAVYVEPDDLETTKREMWVVLSVTSELFVAYDPLQNHWSIIEPYKNNGFVQVVSGETMVEVLNGM